MIYTEQLLKADIDISTSGDNTVISAPTDGRYIAIDFIAFLPTTAVTIQMKQDSTNYGGALPLDAKQAITWENASNNEHGIITLTPNTAFVINLSGNVQVGGIIRYRLVGN